MVKGETDMTDERQEMKLKAGDRVRWHQYANVEVIQVSEDGMARIKYYHPSERGPQRHWVHSRELELGPR